MAFIDRSQEVRRHATTRSARTKELFAAVMLLALMAALTFRAVVSIDALAPAVATLLFVLAAATAGAALLCRGDKLRLTWFDIAGVLTFVGVAITILIDPDQMVRLVTPSDQPD